MIGLQCEDAQVATFGNRWQLRFRSSIWCSTDFTLSVVCQLTKTLLQEECDPGKKQHRLNLRVHAANGVVRTRRAMREIRDPLRQLTSPRPTRSGVRSRESRQPVWGEKSWEKFAGARRRYRMFALTTARRKGKVLVLVCWRKAPLLLRNGLLGGATYVHANTLFAREHTFCTFFCAREHKLTPWCKQCCCRVWISFEKASQWKRIVCHLGSSQLFLRHNESEVLF